MIWGVTARRFNLTLALKNVTDFTPSPHHHYRLHRPFYSQTQLPVFTQLRAFLLFSLIKINCIHLKRKKKKDRILQGHWVLCEKGLLINILINTNHCYLLLCDSFIHVFNLPGMAKPFRVHSSLFRLFYGGFNILIKCLPSPGINWCIKQHYDMKTSLWKPQMSCSSLP